MRNAHRKMVVFVVVVVGGAVVVVWVCVGGEVVLLGRALYSNLSRSHKQEDIEKTQPGFTPPPPTPLTRTHRTYKKACWGFRWSC